MAILTLKSFVLSFIPFFNFVGYICFSLPKMRSLRIFALFTFNNFRRWMLSLSRYSMVWTSA